MIDGSSTILLALLGVLGQVGEEALQRVGHRVEAGDQEEEADAEDLVVGEAVPPDLGGGEHGEQVLLGALASVGQLGGEELLDVLGGDLLVGLDLVDVRALGAQDAVLHLEEHGQLGDREPDQAEEDRRGEGLGQVGGELAAAVVDEPVDELVDQLHDVGLEQVHALGGEDGVEELAVLEVLGRVDLQRDEGDRLAEVHRLHGRGEDLGVAQGVLHVGAQHELDAPEGPVQHAPGLAGPAVVLLGMATDGGVHDLVGVERRVLHGWVLLSVANWSGCRGRPPGWRVAPSVPFGSIVSRRPGRPPGPAAHPPWPAPGGSPRRGRS